jgi:hypothetical protein
MQQAFVVAIATVLFAGSAAAGNNIFLLLNEVGDVLKVDLDTGNLIEKIYISDAYYANRILADPKGRYVLIGGGAQLALFLDPKSLSTKNGLRPAIPRLPWEKSWDGYKRRLRGFDSVYGGEWAITPAG